jgi:DNA-binding XRE family transcriptional regulator
MSESMTEDTSAARRRGRPPLPPEQRRPPKKYPYKNTSGLSKGRPPQRERHLTPAQARMAEIRRLLGRTQAQMAELLGIQVDTFVRYEGGTRNPSGAVQRLAEGLLKEWHAQQARKARKAGAIT